jgi:eukaryotic-like serine/threonine-protein kinase
VFKFITGKPFWVNFLAALVAVVLIIFLILKLLGVITRHGAYLKVPAIIGMKTNEAVALLEKQGFEVYIQDSVFTDTAKRGIVLKQLPDANATVKVNRTVFITVNRYIPPMLDMPKLEGQNLSFAIRMLERNHLKLGDTTFRPDFMQGSVLEQLYNGNRIPEKAKIQWGSTIDLVIGGGLEDRQIPVPTLVGMTYAEAKAYLDENGISLGAIIADGVITDTASAYIFKQRPDRLDQDNMLIYIRSGQLMDVWISKEMRTPSEDSLPKKKEEPKKKKEKTTP